MSKRVDYVSIVDLVPNKCPRCIEHFMANTFMVEALASVGIEHGKSSGEMAEDFYAVFHNRGHKEP